MDGREIILKIKNNENEIFSDIIDDYSNYLATVIRNVYSVNIQDIEDIIAETLLTVWKNSKKLNENLNFKAYLATIARNKTVDYVRKKRANIIELDLNLSDNIDIETDYLHRELMDFIYRKIEEAKEPDKTIMSLKYHHGLNSNEIADKLNLNQNIVDIRLSRQRTKLKKMLSEMEV